MLNPLGTGTWTRGNGIIDWTFDLARHPNETSDEAILRGAVAALECLQDFAFPSSVAWSARSGGEDVVVLRGDQVTSAAMVREGGKLSEVHQIMFGLDLMCVAPDAKTIVVLPGDGLLWLEVEDDVPDREWGIYVVLSLDTDIYAARTWGESRDNRALAALNAPRVNGFLDRLRAALGLSLRSIDADSYDDQVSERGFNI